MSAHADSLLEKHEAWHVLKGLRKSVAHNQTLEFYLPRDELESAISTLEDEIREVFGEMKKARARGRDRNGVASHGLLRSYPRTQAEPKYSPRPPPARKQPVRTLKKTTSTVKWKPQPRPEPRRSARLQSALHHRRTRDKDLEGFVVPDSSGDDKRVETSRSRRGTAAPARPRVSAPDSDSDIYLLARHLAYTGADLTGQVKIDWLSFANQYPKRCRKGWRTWYIRNPARKERVDDLVQKYRVEFERQQREGVE